MWKFKNNLISIANILVTKLLKIYPLLSFLSLTMLTLTFLYRLIIFLITLDVQKSKLAVNQKNFKYNVLSPHFQSFTKEHYCFTNM